MAATGMSKAPIQVNMTLPREKRPLSGYDIELWRGEAGLNKHDAANALGLRTAYYHRLCRRQSALPFEVELLVRLYLAYPGERSWKRYDLPELFEMMYGGFMKPFVGDPEYEVFARVDLRERFTTLFGRSTARQYDWLEPRRNKTAMANPVIDAILSKLKNVPQPTIALETIASQVLALRGIDLDAQFPIPTRSNPPKREKSGRRPQRKAEKPVAAKKAAAKKAAEKSPTAKKAPAKKAAAKRAGSGSAAARKAG